MPYYDLDPKNKYYSLYAALRDDILRGKYRTGEKLPAKRALAAELGVSVVTVELAYGQLLAEGYAESRERSGYFVGEVSPLPAGGRTAATSLSAERAKSYVADLVAPPVPAELFPFSVWAKLMRGVLADCGEHLLERVPAAGDGELRAEIAAYLYRSRGIDVDPSRVIVGAGAEYLYGLTVRLLGRDKAFAVENPGYGNISESYSINGARVVYIPVGGRGADVDALKASRADVLHISPSHQFPTGAVTPASARLRLVEWARGGDRYIVEDDYDSEFRLSGRPLQSLFGLCPDRVIYINTFSRSLAPSMRMGYMVLPEKLYGDYMRLFSSSANVVPLFEQKTLAAMLGGGYFERHINRLKKYYREMRREVTALLCGLPTPCEITDSGSGPHLLCRFPAAESDGAVKAYAERLGVRLKCVGDYLAVPAPAADKTAVINYSGVTRAQLGEVKRRLAELSAE